jgi:hypothetical protein
MYKIGDKHPRFSLLAFSGYDAETGKECWASIAIEGREGAFAAFRENKRVHSPSIHPTCNSQDADNRRSFAHPTSRQPVQIPYLSDTR